MRREENPGGGNQIVMLLVVGGIAYVGYQYLVSSGLWAQWFGGATPQPALPPGTTTATLPGTTMQQLPPTPAPQPTPTPVVSSQLATQLQSAGNAFMAASGAQGLNIDQWVFYYQQIKGVTLTGAQVESLIVSAGVTDATRGNIIPLATFLNALGHAGLSGIIPVPNQGPITAPLPTTQNFRAGYGGYAGGGRSNRRGYLN